MARQVDDGLGAAEEAAAVIQLHNRNSHSLFFLGSFLCKVTRPDFNTAGLPIS